MTTCFRALTVAVSVAWFLPARAHGQPVPRELSVVPCPGCALTERVVAALGLPNDSVVVTMWSRVVRLGPTRYLVGPVSIPGRLAIYRSDGTLERSVRLPPAFYRDGTPYESPHQIGPMFESASGGAMVFDTGNQRLTLIDSLGHMRTYAMMGGSVHGGLSLPDGRAVISGEHYPSSSSIGHPLHIIDSARIIRSFGPALDLGKLRRLSLPPDFRVVASARAGNLWASPSDRYELSLYDSVGRVLTILTRPFASPPPGPDGTVAFGVASIREDANGYLWVVTGRRGGAGDLKPDERITNETLRGLAAGLTSTIDIIDPKRGAVIYSHSYPGPSALLIGDGLVYRHRDEANGRNVIEVVSLRFADPTGRATK